MEHRGRYSIFFDNLNGKEILWLPECIYVCIYVYRVYICITDAQMGRKSEKESVCVCVCVCVCVYIYTWTWLVVQTVKHLPAMLEAWV